MRLSLGIFAHNEEQNIGAMLDSLFGQSLFDATKARELGLTKFQILCLANGCTDATAEVAERHRRDLPPYADYRIVNIAEPGKSRTWNQYVHHLSDPEADFLILMDADINFDGDHVIELLLGQLASDAHAQAATDTPLKSFTRGDSTISIADRASSAASKQVSKVGVLCGQLYCARAEMLRRIWLPPALPVEDGFLAAMIKTSGFTSPDDPSRIAWVPNARHFYRTHRSIAGYIAHEARIIVGSVINSWLFQILWEEGRTGHAGAYVHRRNEEDSNWLSDLVQEKVRTGGAWLIPAHFMLWRLAALRVATA